MDNAQDNSKLKFGLVGRNISYSFSRGYFADKFKKESLPHSYVNFDLQSIEELDERNHITSHSDLLSTLMLIPKILNSPVLIQINIHQLLKIWHCLFIFVRLIDRSIGLIMLFFFK
mgnify:CR=1 FL=1